MKSLILVISLMAVTGCATAHDYCVSHADHYNSYNECYAERQQKKQNVRQAMSGFNDLGSTSQPIGNCRAVKGSDGLMYKVCN